jgi:hypothetical protein
MLVTNELDSKVQQLTNCSSTPKTQSEDFHWYYTSAFSAVNRCVVGKDIGRWFPGIGDAGSHYLCAYNAQESGITVDYERRDDHKEEWAMV